MIDSSGSPAQHCRDAVDLTSGEMLLRVMKTGRKQYLRLGQPAVEALGALRPKGEYFFWNGDLRVQDGARAGEADHSPAVHARRHYRRTSAPLPRHVLRASSRKGRATANGPTSSRAQQHQDYGKALRAVGRFLSSNAGCGHGQARFWAGKTKRFWYKIRYSSRQSP